MYKKGILFLALFTIIVLLFSSCEPEWKKEIEPLTLKLQELEAAAEKVKSGDEAAIASAKSTITEILEIQATLEQEEESRTAWNELIAQYGNADTLIKSESLDDFKIISDAKIVIEKLNKPADDFIAAYNKFRASGGKDPESGKLAQSLGAQLQAEYDRFQALEEKLTSTGKDSYNELKQNFFRDHPGLLNAMGGK